jgi:hypothetical protein
LIARTHWCAAAQVLDGQIQPVTPAILALDACDVTTRGQARMWSTHNPDVSLAEACPSRTSN